MLKELLLTTAYSTPVREYVTQGKLMQGLVNRFIAGESLDQAVSVVRSLNQTGKTATLDFVGEQTSNLDKASKSKDEYLYILDTIAKEKLNANVSLKLTQLGLSINEQACEENLKTILDNAASENIFVRIDMESSLYTQKTLDIFHKLFYKYDNFGVVIQASLLRSKADLYKLTNRRARVRLCKGAYKEPENVAFQRKKDVDLNYKDLTETLLTVGNYPAIATHDEKMIDATKNFSRNFFIDPQKFEFQMLYGIRDDLQDKLVDEGYNLRIYVPYGKEWYPYFVRRLFERPANLFFFLKNL